MQIKPEYGKDYGPGYVLFSRRDSSFLSDGITWFQSLREAAEFVASHVLIVINEERGIESADRGVEYCNLKDYIDSPSCQVVCREPNGLNEKAISQMFKRAEELEKKEVGYDYTGLILGYPLSLLLGLSEWIKPLRKVPIPFHLPGSRVCSGFVSDCLYHTDEYRNVKLFKEWHYSRITPVML
jgi:hypothetical protein